MLRAVNDCTPQVSDAISMLRLRFGEPVRFKFLIGETCVLILSIVSILHLHHPNHHFKIQSSAVKA